VRSVSPQIDLERAVVGFADHRDRAAPAERPARGDRLGLRRVEGKYLQQPAGRREGSVVTLVAGVSKRGERPGHAGAPLGRGPIHPDFRHRVGIGLGHAHAVGIHPDHGLAFGRQQSFVGIEADRVDAEGRAVAEDLHHPGHRPQAPGTVEDEHDVGLTETVGAALRADFGPLGDRVEEVSHLSTGGIGVGADSHGGTLPVAGARVR
jgi:hypothetical protein